MKLRDKLVQQIRETLARPHTEEEIRKLAELKDDLVWLETYQKLDFYEPYDYQKNFHKALGFQSDSLSNNRAIIAGNKLGKTYCIAAEVAMHATGRYPDWWEGHQFTTRIEIMCGSESNELTRDVIQKELLGDPEDKDLLGTGSIPKEYIGKITRKAGVPNAIDSVMIKNDNGGWSRIFFRAYEQGKKKHMGFHIHFGWLDEEPPEDILNQYLRATLTTHGIIATSFTPESGVTNLYNTYVNAPRKGMAVIKATWDDCPLFDDPEYKAQALAQFPAHERELRMKGIPVMGSGLIFTTPDDEIIVDPFEIPRHWPRIRGLDIGSDHPFAVVEIAFDPESDTAYVVWAHKKSRSLLAEQAAMINSTNPWIPVAWPHDGLQEDKQSGKPLADIYREPPYSVNMLPQCFSNPPPPGKKEGQGGQGVEVGLMAMDEAMHLGKFKVFSTLKDWFTEKAMYHRQEGKIVKKLDDIMAATRYAYQSRRFATVQKVRRPTQNAVRGSRNW